MSITNENEAAKFKHHRRTLQRLKIISIAQMYCFKAIKIQRFFKKSFILNSHRKNYALAKYIIFLKYFISLHRYPILS